MCDDLEATIADLKSRGAEFEGEPSEHDWGVVTRLKVPGGGTLALYKARHPSPSAAERTQAGGGGQIPARESPARGPGGIGCPERESGGRPFGRPPLSRFRQSALPRRLDRYVPLTCCQVPGTAETVVVCRESLVQLLMTVWL